MFDKHVVKNGRSDVFPTDLLMGSQHLKTPATQLFVQQLVRAVIKEALKPCNIGSFKATFSGDH